VLLDRRADLHEILEQLRQLLRRDADARVVHGEGDGLAVVIQHGAHAHLAAQRELERVGDVVAQNMRQLLVVRV
jgi:hypothetical protein